jgi:hypothetical protein
MVASKFNLPSFNELLPEGGPIDWMRVLSDSGSKQEKRCKVGILFTFWWINWSKERNMRIFENAELSTPCLASLIIEVERMQNSIYAGLMT